MMLCYTSDLHGDAGLYAQLDALVRAERPELLILGGDLLGDGDRNDPRHTQVRFVDTELLPRIAAWRAAVPGLWVACLPGNHEWLCTYEALVARAAQGGYTVLSHERAWTYRGFRFLGLMYTPPTPHYGKDLERLDLPGDAPPAWGGVVWDPKRGTVVEVSAAEHFRQNPSLEQILAPAPPTADPWILVAHAPPYDTALDRLPGHPQPIGSRAVRAFIETRQPALALHGHVHESPQVSGRYFEIIGRTLCINPGQGHDRLHAVLLDLNRPSETLRHTVLA